MSRVGQASSAMPIPQIQGRGALSAYDGKRVTTTGVVTAVRTSGSNPGFFLQDPVGDHDAATSDAIFVSTKHLSERALGGFRPGQTVEVAGTVDEPDTFTTLVASAEGITVTDAAERATPAPATLDIPATDGARKTYLEAREGMLTRLDNAMALGPTSSYYGTTMIDESKQGPKRDADGKNAARHLAVNGMIGPRTQFQTGDRAGDVHGPLNYIFGDYELLQVGSSYGEIKRAPLPPKAWGDLNNDGRIGDGDIAAIRKRSGSAAQGPLDPADLNADGKITATDARQAKARMERSSGEPTFTVANLNAHNFFDADDAPPPVDDDVVSKNEYQTKLAKMAAAIRDQLGSPDLIALEEVENTRVMDDLLSRPELRGLGYGYAQLPTTGHRSINPTLLYRKDSVKVTDIRQVQKQVSVDESADAGDRVGRDGRLADTGPLFSRQPLMVDATVTKDGRSQDITLSVNHLISKYSPMGTPTDPIRIAQGKFLHGLVKDLRAAHPDREVIVIGDLNDTPDSAAIKALRGTGKRAVLHDSLAKAVPAGERYTYNYKGNTQVIDHVLVTDGLAKAIDGAGIHHFGADLPAQYEWSTTAYRASDHDAPYVSFRLPAPPAAAEDAAAGAAATR